MVNRLTPRSSSLRSLYVKYAGLSIVAFLFSSNVILAQQQPAPQKRTTFNRKAPNRRISTRNNSPATSAHLHTKKSRIYTQSLRGNYPTTSPKEQAQSIYANRQHLRLLRQHNVFKQKGTANFAAHTGRAMLNRTPSAARNRKNSKKVFQTKKTFLKSITRPSPRTQRHQPDRPTRPSYDTRRQQTRPEPKGHYSIAKWNMGWYKKWNRTRIAKASQQGEHAWKGDIAGRKPRINNWAIGANLSQKNIVQPNKNYPSIGGNLPNSKQYAMSLKILRRRIRKIHALVGAPTRLRIQQNPSSNRYAVATKAPSFSFRKTSAFAGNIPKPRLKQNPNSNRYAVATKAPSFSFRKATTFAGNIPKPRLKQNPNSNRYAVATKAPSFSFRKATAFAGNIPRPRLKQNPNSNRYAVATKAPSFSFRKATAFAGNIPRPHLKQNPNSNRYAVATKAPSSSFRKATAFAGNIRIPGPRFGINGNPLNPLGTSPNRAAQQFSGNMKVRKFNSPALHPDAQFAHSFITNTPEKRTMAVTLKLFWAKVFRKKNLQPPHLRAKVKKLHYDDRERKLWYR